MGKRKYFERDLYETGKIENEKYFENGLQEGWQIHYSEDGSKAGEMHFNKGIRNGLTHEFLENGRIGFEGTCVNGQFEGLSTWYFENGKINFTGNRHLDKDTGWWYFFNPVGDTIRRKYTRSIYDTTQYFNGKGKHISSEEWENIR